MSRDFAVNCVPGQLAESRSLNFEQLNLVGLIAWRNRFI
jgi:hypothetical protein